MKAEYCPACMTVFDPDKDTCKCVGITMDKAINETHAQIKTAVAKRNEEEYKRIWNSAIEAAAHQVMINVFHEAQDSEWDLGFNKCKEVAFNKIRELKK